jgi:hypothetical protein
MCRVIPGQATTAGRSPRHALPRRHLPLVAPHVIGALLGTPSGWPTTATRPPRVASIAHACPRSRRERSVAVPAPKLHRGAESSFEERRTWFMALGQASGLPWTPPLRPWGYGASSASEAQVVERSSARRLLDPCGRGRRVGPEHSGRRHECCSGSDGSEAPTWCRPALPACARCRAPGRRTPEPACCPRWSPTSADAHGVGPPLELSAVVPSRAGWTSALPRTDGFAPRSAIPTARGRRARLRPTATDGPSGGRHRFNRPRAERHADDRAPNVPRGTNHPTSEIVRATPPCDARSTTGQASPDTEAAPLAFRPLLRGRTFHVEHPPSCCGCEETNVPPGPPHRLRLHIRPAERHPRQRTRCRSHLIDGDPREPPLTCPTASRPPAARPAKGEADPLAVQARGQTQSRSRPRRARRHDATSTSGASGGPTGARGACIEVGCAYGVGREPSRGAGQGGSGNSTEGTRDESP